MNLAYKNTEFVSCKFKDKLVHGLRCIPENYKGTLVIHIHGSWGNFYENPFVVEMLNEYTKLGFGFASINLSSHDGGTINESFDETLEEISQWIEFLCDSNTKVVLQGHSLGALKVIRMYELGIFSDALQKVSQCIFLSPFDLVAFYGGPNIERRRAHAKEFRDENGGKAIVPVSIFNIWPISVGTFLELSEPESEFDLFPSRHANFDYLNKIEKPKLIVLGENDNASFPSAKNVYDELKKFHVNSNTQVALIEEAVHNFAGKEKQLVEVVINFLNDTIES